MVKTAHNYQYRHHFLKYKSFFFTGDHWDIVHCIGTVYLTLLLFVVTLT